jgi:hemoglobin
MSFDVSHGARRAALAEAIAAETGIDDSMIEVLVGRFYEKVQADGLLGPVFETRIRDWEPHLKRMRDFWSSVALMTGRYHGTPMAKHLRARRIAESLEIGIAGANGVLLAKGQRYRSSAAA